VSARSILILSLGANLLLAGWLLKAWSHRPPALVPVPEEKAASAVTASRSLRTLRTNVVTFTTNTVEAPGFRWAQLETNDFRAYAANLRAVGCPEKTLRDILFPDIAKAFGERRGELKRTPEPFWQNTRQRARLEKELALKQEEKALAFELTGAPWTAKAQDLWVNQDDAAFALGFLAEGKALPMVGILEGLDEVSHALRDQTRGFVTEEDLARTRAMAEAIRRDVTAPLTPAEAEELALRGFDAVQDGAAGGRRHVGVQLTGVEHRELLRLACAGRDWMVEVLADALVNDGDGMEEIRGVRPANFEAEALALLGPQRFADYQRSQDKDFHAALKAAEDSNRPESVALQAYDIVQTALAGARQLAGESSMSKEQQKAALEAMHRETTAALTNLYGSKQGEFFARNIQRSMRRETQGDRP